MAPAQGSGTAYLRALNKQNNPEAVIAAYESGSVASSEAALGEYVKALVRVDRLDSGALMHTMQAGSAHHTPCIAPAQCHAAPPSSTVGPTSETAVRPTQQPSISLPGLQVDGPLLKELQLAPARSCRWL